MSLITQFFSALIIFTINIFIARALPAPMDEKTMTENSDFIGKINVMGITEIEDDKNIYKNIKVKQYNAWLQILSQKKGKYDKMDTIVYCWREPPTEKLLGSWFISLKKGEKAYMYLKFNPNKTCYEALNYQAKVNN